MGGMLVDDEQAVGGLGQNVGALQLPQDSEFGKPPVASAGRLSGAGGGPGARPG